MGIKLSDHFTYRKLFRFTFPSIVMMIFTSIYGVVDGFFVSNYVGKTPFAAVNFIMPFLMILGGLGFIFGTGGSALIAKTLGQGDRERANRIFSMLVYVSFALGVIIATFGIIFLRPVAAMLGAEGELLENCVAYGKIIMIAIPATTLQYEFQSFFVVAEKPHLGLCVTIAAGVTNMVLDALLVGVFSQGLAGAATATAFSQFIGGIVPFIYFKCKNKSLLRLTKTKFDGGALLKTLANGSSELMSNISMSLVGMLYNIQLLNYSGENGVAAYGVLMYVNMIFIATFIGYSVGSAPLVSFHYGAENKAELHDLLRKSLIIISCLSVSMLFFALLLSKPLTVIFVGYDTSLVELTEHGFNIFSFSFLFSGIAIFGSSFFTALNNGPISALISFLRTLVFQFAAVMIFPLLMGIEGIWFSVVAAELMAAAVTTAFLSAKRKKYGY